MTNGELTQQIKQILAAENAGTLEAEYTYYALRFENAEREIGEILPQSKHNPDRQDEREFPEFGSQEYDALPMLDGTSGWVIADEYGTYNPHRYYQAAYQHDDDEIAVVTKHCYIIAGDDDVTHDDADDGEIVIANAVVIAKIF